MARPSPRFRHLRPAAAPVLVAALVAVVVVAAACTGTTVAMSAQSAPVAVGPVLEILKADRLPR
jgi:hypothetical protein